MKATDIEVTMEYLESRVHPHFGPAKWIEFCAAMIDLGFRVTLYEARETVSKYITVWEAGCSFKVRFSNHAPNYNRLVNNDCDFFVGKTQEFITNTGQATEAVKRFFGMAADSSIKMPTWYS